MVMADNIMDLTNSIRSPAIAMDVDNEEAAPESPESLLPAGFASPPPSQIPTIPPYAVLRARQVVVDFLMKRAAEELVPHNSKIVVVDSRIRLGQAFKALFDHGVRVAAVCDTDVFQFIGALTVTDIMESLIQFHYTSANHDIAIGLHHYEVVNWLEEKQARLGRSAPPPVIPESVPPTSAITNDFLCADSAGSLYDACAMLSGNGMHRLPILWKGHKLVSTLEHWRVLRFVHENLADQAKAGTPSLFDLSIGELGIGSFGHVVTCRRGEQLVAVLERMRDHDLSAVPIVDDIGRICDVYSRADVAVLMGHEGRGLNLQMTVGDTLKAMRYGFDRVETCRTNHSLRHVFERLDQTRKHRLYFVDDNGRLEGVVSLSDLLRYFMEGV